METYYTLLGVAADATDAVIAAAYERQREGYRPERVMALDEELRRVASERSALLDRAYAVLSDPQQRSAYDRQIAAAAGDSPSAMFSRRELVMGIAGVLAGLVVIALVWVLTGRSAQSALPPIAEVHRPAPDFALPDLQGRTVRLSDYRGKVVLLNFWWSGCEPCKEETPALQAAYRKLAAQGLEIIGVNTRDNERAGSAGDADIRDFVARYGVSYPIALDQQSEAGRAFQVYVLPTSFFIDQTGTVRYVRFSTVKADEVERLFIELQREATALH